MPSAPAHTPAPVPASPPKKRPSKVAPVVVSVKARVPPKPKYDPLSFGPARALPATREHAREPALPRKAVTKPATSPAKTTEPVPVSVPEPEPKSTSTSESVPDVAADVSADAGAGPSPFEPRRMSIMSLGLQEIQVICNMHHLVATQNANECDAKQKQKSELYRREGDISIINLTTSLPPLYFSPRQSDEECDSGDAAIVPMQQLNAIVAQVSG